MHNDESVSLTSKHSVSICHSVTEITCFSIPAVEIGVWVVEISKALFGASVMGFLEVLKAK